MQITRICKSLIIISLKNMIIFLKKHVHVFWKSRTCFPKNMYVFSEKDVHVSEKTRTCFFKGNSGIILMRLQPVLSLAAIGDQGDL